MASELLIPNVGGVQPQREQRSEALRTPADAEAFAKELSNMAGAYITTAVVDSTGLSGKYDFDLKWTARALLALAGSDAITIYDAVDKQLGLKLQAQKLPSSSLSNATTRRGVANCVPNFIACTSPRHVKSVPEIPVGKPM